MNHILFVITDLGLGGAETVLYRICKFSPSYRITVVSLGSNYVTYEKLNNLPNVRCFSLNLPKLPTFQQFLNAQHVFQSIVDECKPDIISAFMYHAEFFTSVHKLMYPTSIPLVWNIRNSTLSLTKSSISTLIIVPLLALFSYFIPSRIICCAFSSASLHGRLAYNTSRMKVIHNGVDPNHFRDIGLSRASKTLYKILIVGRFSPQKDFITAFRSLTLVRTILGDQLTITLVGNNLSESNVALVKMLKAHDLFSFTTLLGIQEDMPKIYNEHHVTLLTSAYGEACPNVLIESIACNTPVVATDVGDSRIITNKYGFVVPPKSPNLTAFALLKAYEFRMPSDYSNYIHQNYSISLMARRYMELHTSVYN
jgi:glycosyltransferase involved in cell wall biosynthesis